MTCYRKYLLIMELSFDAILCSKVSNGNSEASHIKCSRECWFPTSGLKLCLKVIKKSWIF